MSMDKKTEAFREIANDLGYSRKDMADLMGRPQETANSWLNKTKPGPPQDVIESAGRMKDKVLDFRIKKIEASKA